jgi:hypothetical protein
MTVKGKGKIDYCLYLNKNIHKNNKHLNKLKTDEYRDYIEIKNLEKREWELIIKKYILFIKYPIKKESIFNCVIKPIKIINPIGRNWSVAKFIEKNCFKRKISFDINIMYIINDYLNWLPAKCWYTNICCIVCGYYNFYSLKCCNRNNKKENVWVPLCSNDCLNIYKKKNNIIILEIGPNTTLYDSYDLYELF